MRELMYIYMYIYKHIRVCSYYEHIGAHTAVVRGAQIASIDRDHKSRACGTAFMYILGTYRRWPRIFARPPPLHMRRGPVSSSTLIYGGVDGAACTYHRAESFAAAHCRRALATHFSHARARRLHGILMERHSAV